MTIDNKVETAPMVCYRLSPIILQSCNACNCKETHYNFKNAIGRPLKLVLLWTQFPFPASGQTFLAVIKPSFAWKERRATSALPSYLPCQPWRLDPTFVRDRIGTPRGTTRHEGRTRLRNKGQNNGRSTGMRRCAIKGAQAKLPHAVGLRQDVAGTRAGFRREGTSPARSGPDWRQPASALRRGGSARHGVSGLAAEPGFFVSRNTRREY